MNGPLGCIEDVVILATDKTGTSIGEIPYSRLTWRRALDNWSGTDITIPTNAPDCCAMLADLRPWRHEISVFRDGVLVWGPGPIVRLEFTRDEVTIFARDVLALLDKRVVMTAQTYVDADLSTIAEGLIRDALSVDDHGALAFLDVTPTGITGSRSYAVNDGPVMDLLVDLARVGLDFTALGKRIILGAAPFSRTGLLGCDDFLGTPGYIIDGLTLATSAVVLGNGAVGTAGGEDSYYGLLTVIERQDDITTTAGADEAAASIVAANNPPVTIVQLPAPASLSPEAPVGINDLIPGATMPVAFDCLCPEVAQETIIIGLEVTVDAEGESVAPTAVRSGAQDASY